MMIGKQIYSILKKLRDSYLFLRRKKYIHKLEKLIPESKSVFSMNCFAGRIYQDLGREYTTPTAGLFFLAEDFIALGRDINIIKRDIEEVQESKWDGTKDVFAVHGKYPIGRFKGTDIEIHFLHYPTFEEAADKWKRRVKRFNFNDFVFIAFCQNGWDGYPNYFKDFSVLPVKQKYLFTNIENTMGSDSIISIKSFRHLKDSPDPYKKAHIFYRELLRRML